MKILTGEEARKLVDEAMKDKALPDDAMEDVAGGFIVHHGSKYQGDKKWEVLYLGPDEYDWFMNTHTGRLLYERIAEKCDVSYFEKSLRIIRIIDDEDTYHLLAGILEEHGFSGEHVESPF